MPGVAGHGRHQPLVPVQAIPVAAAGLVPEHGVEAVEQGLRLGSQRGGAVRVAQGRIHLRHALPGRIDVALQFAQRLRVADEGAVGVDDGLPAVLPADVLVSRARPGAVLLKAVAVPVPALVDPGQATLGGVQVPAQQIEVPGRAPGGMEGDQVKRRCVRRAVIRRVRDQVQRRQLAPAKLVQDLARLGVPVVVPRGGLPIAQYVQRGAAELRVQDRRLQGDDQRVPPEQRHEPRQPGGGDGLQPAIPLYRKAQGGDVLHGLVEHAGEGMAVAVQLEDAGPPGRQVLPLRAAHAQVAGGGRREHGISVAQVVKQRALPCPARRQFDREADAAVGIDGWRRAAGGDADLAVEVPVAVARGEHAVRVRPAAADPAAAQDAAGLHLEDVGEVAADRQFQVEAHGVAAVVGDGIRLVHAAADGPAEHHAEGAGRHVPALAGEGAVGQEDAGGVVGGGTAVDQLPGLAVGIQGVCTDKAGVEEV